jgi:hypothetical protein
VDVEARQAALEGAAAADVGSVEARATELLAKGRGQEALAELQGFANARAARFLHAWNELFEVCVCVCVCAFGGLWRELM